MEKEGENYNLLFNEQLKKKDSKILRLFTILSIAAFAFALYLFFATSVSNKGISSEEFNEQGTLLYALNLANPLSLFSNMDPLIIVMILVIVIIIILVAIFIVIYSKIGTIKKVKTEQEKISTNPINPPVQKEENPQSTEENPVQIYSQYNAKVLELIEEGEEFLNRKQYTNARITYHKIREWYDPNSDKTKEIYLKIIRFYEKIVAEEI